MFTRYKLGYQLLLLLTVLAFAISIGFGTAPLSKFVPSAASLYKKIPAWTIIPLIWAGAVAIEIARRKVDRPLVALRRLCYRQRHWFLRGAFFMFVILYFSMAFTSFKKAIPRHNPYYADPIFVKMDQFIFGIDPWNYTHAIIGPVGTQFIDRVYIIWFLVILLYVGWFCFTRNQILQLRGLLAYLLSWTLLGNLLAVTLSSVGPCFYEHFYGNPQFSPLMTRLRAMDSDSPLFAIQAMDYLIDSIGKDRLGVGISAMPSLHVSIAFLCFLVAWEYGRHWWAKLLGLVFFLIIAVGSVHLGWHYAVDGILSIIVTGLIWWSTGRFARWLEKREAALTASAPQPNAGQVPAPA